MILPFVIAVIVVDAGITELVVSVMPIPGNNQELVGNAITLPDAVAEIATTV